jgi:hypothetical protein
VITVLVDHNLEGQALHLWVTLEEMGWFELVSLHLVTLRDIGLPLNSSDRTVWRFAQEHQMLLLTDNRNMKDKDSLEQTLRDENMPRALPVITVGSSDRLDDRAYRERCAERLAEIAFDLDQYLGVGRLFIP